MPKYNTQEDIIDMIKGLEKRLSLIERGNAFEAGMSLQKLRLTGLDTTTNSGNLYHDNTTKSVLRGTTSDEAFKLDQQPLVIALEDILYLADNAITWIDKTEHELDPETGHRIAGWTYQALVARENFQDFVQDDGEMKTVNYDRLTAVLAIGIKILHERLSDLENG